jgi:hypothetical protein
MATTRFCQGIPALFMVGQAGMSAQDIEDSRLNRPSKKIDA